MSASASIPDAPLAMNRFVDIHIHPPPEAYPIDVARIEAITVRCPVRGRGLVIRELTPAGDPALFAWFLGMVAHGGELDLDSDAPLVPELVRLGFLVTEDDVVAWPAFEVPLPDVAAGAAAPDATWRVSDTFRFQPAFALHPGLRWPADYTEQEGRLGCFAPGPTFWVGDPAALITPYWITAEAAAILAGLVPGAAPPPLPPSLARSLAQVGALVPIEQAWPVPPAHSLAHADALVSGEQARPAPPAHSLAHVGALVPIEQARPVPLDAWARHHAAFARDGYTVARDLLPAWELAALRRYYAALLAAGLIPLGDRQNVARYSAYNDPVGRFVHARLAAGMSAVVGRPVVPAFSYFFSYLEGAALAPHKDRAQAEFSISLQIDHAPEPAAETGWPLQLVLDDGRAATADPRIGDAVLYHGRALTHHRAALPPGQRSSVLVLEYVPRDFRGLLI